MGTVQEMQQRQADYDEQYWQHHEKDEKIRHVTLHIGKLLGKLSTYCEAREHGNEITTEQIEKEVIPDLQVYAAQLANLLGIELNDAHRQRLEDNIKRLHST